MAIFNFYVNLPFTVKRYQMIKELKVSGFTCFEENTFEFSPNINIIIGKNGTGKTHVLKLLASIISSNDILLKSSTNSKEKFENIIAEQLIAFFKPEQLGRLVRRQQGRTSAKIKVKVNKTELCFSFANNSKSNVKIDNNADWKALNFLYLPPREMFSLYEGFLSLHETPMPTTDFSTHRGMIKVGMKFHMTLNGKILNI